MKKTNYKIILTKKQLLIIKEYWKRFKSVEDYYYRSVGELERDMAKATQIKDLEFFFCDGECVGIGDYNRMMQLIQREKLDE